MRNGFDGDAMGVGGFDNPGRETWGSSPTVGKSAGSLNCTTSSVLTVSISILKVVDQCHSWPAISRLREKPIL